MACFKGSAQGRLLRLFVFTVPLTQWKLLRFFVAGVTEDRNPWCFFDDLYFSPLPIGTRNMCAKYPTKHRPPWYSLILPTTISGDWVAGMHHFYMSGAYSLDILWPAEALPMTYKLWFLRFDVFVLWNFKILASVVIDFKVFWYASMLQGFRSVSESPSQYLRCLPNCHMMPVEKNMDIWQTVQWEKNWTSPFLKELPCDPTLTRQTGSFSL